MVPEAGLEPAHHFWRRILNPVRLPIPPLWQFSQSSSYAYTSQPTNK